MKCDTQPTDITTSLSTSYNAAIQKITPTHYLTGTIYDKVILLLRQFWLSVQQWVRLSWK